MRNNAALHASLSAVTAAVVGVILNLSVWFAIHTLFGSIEEHGAGFFHAELPVWSSIHPAAALMATAKSLRT